MVAAKGKGRRVKKPQQESKWLTEKELDFVEGAIATQMLEHEQKLDVQKIRTVFKKKVNRDISKKTIYKIRQTEKMNCPNDQDVDHEENDDQASESGTSHRGQHRPRVTTPEEDELIVRVIEKNNRLPWAEIQQILKGQHGIELSVDTIVLVGLMKITYKDTSLIKSPY